MVDGVPKRNLSDHWLSKFHEYIVASNSKNYSYHLLGEQVTGVYPIEISLAGHHHILEMIKNMDGIIESLKNTGSAALLWIPEELDDWVVDSPTLFGMMEKFKSRRVKVITVCSDMYRKNNPRFDGVASLRLSLNIFDQATKNCLSREGFDENNIVKTPRKHYICLNNMIRPSKIYVLSQLLKKNLLDHGHVSALNSKKVERHNEIFGDIRASYLRDDEKQTRIIDIHRFIDEHLSYTEDPPKTPLELDKRGMNFDPWEFYYNYENKPFRGLLAYHNESCISVVNETESTQIRRHQFSEKIYLPIAFKTPFMVVANPGYLAQLRSYGYQTFPEIFDESYDDVDDPIRRADMVISQLETYCSKPLVDIKKDIDLIKEKLEYNHHLLLSYRDYSLVIDELFNRMKCFLRK